MTSSSDLPRRLRTLALAASAAASLVFAAVPAAHAHSTASELSLLSTLPLVVSVAAPVALIVGGASLVVVSVEAVAEGTVWVLARASDGARATLRFSSQVAGGVSVAAGTAVMVTAMASGYLLSAAGKVIAFIPNEVGASLLYNERVSR